MAIVAPGPDTSEAPTLIGITAALHLISLSTYGARMYTRSRPVLRLGWDDYFITAAIVSSAPNMLLTSCWGESIQICDMIEWILLMISTGYGLGRHNFYIAPGPAMQAEKFLFISQPPFAWALAFTKISIACMLLRIQRSRNWMIFLYLMMVLQLLTAITINVFQFTLCNPVAAIWNPSIPGATCKLPIVGQISIYVTAAVTIFTDVTFSLLPLTFIVRIQRPLREKIALSCVMGLGLIASFGSIFKTTLVKHYGVTGDTLRDGIGLSIWSVMEVQLGWVDPLHVKQPVKPRPHILAVSLRLAHLALNSYSTRFLAVLVSCQAHSFPSALDMGVMAAARATNWVQCAQLLKILNWDGTALLRATRVFCPLRAELGPKSRTLK